MVGFVLKFVEGAFHVPGHGQVDSVGRVVPVEGNAKVAGAGPFSGDRVKFLETVDEMFGMFAAHVFYAEVVNNQRESNGASAVAEETGCAGCGKVAVGGKMFGEAVVGENAGLGKAVHAFLYFDKDEAVFYEWGKVVLGQDAVWNVAKGNAHVFEVFHWSIQVEVGDVDRHEACVRGRYDTVEEAFCGGDVGGGAVNFSEVFRGIRCGRRRR